MSWSVFNLLKFGAKPVWLVRVEVAGNVYHMNTSAKDVSTPIGSPNASFEDETIWVASNIGLSDLKRTANMGKATVDIRFPTTSQIAQDFIHSPSAWRATIEVWQGFHGDPDNEYLRMLIGQAIEIKPQKPTVTVVFSDQTISAVNKGLERVIQAPCPYELFGRGCKLNPALFTVAGTLSTVNGRTLTISAAAGETDGYFNRGRIVYQGDEQTIASHVGSSIVLAGPFPVLQNATLPVNVDLLPGCRKSMAACDDFGNILNYGGFPEILDSPYTGNGLN